LQRLSGTKKRKRKTSSSHVGGERRLSPAKEAARKKERQGGSGHSDIGSHKGGRENRSIESMKRGISAAPPLGISERKKIGSSGNKEKVARGVLGGKEVLRAEGGFFTKEGERPSP